MDVDRIADGDTPTKRFKVGDYLTSLNDNHAAVESPADIGDDDQVDDETPIDAAPAPVVNDLYLETVSTIPVFYMLTITGKPIDA